MPKIAIEVELTSDQLLRALQNLSETEKETLILELNHELGRESLDAKARVYRRETASFEEVFGHSQPSK